VDVIMFFQFSRPKELSCAQSFNQEMLSAPCIARDVRCSPPSLSLSPGPHNAPMQSEGQSPPLCSPANSCYIVLPLIALHINSNVTHPSPPCSPNAPIVAAQRPTFYRRVFTSIPSHTPWHGVTYAVGAFVLCIIKVVSQSNAL
jgi:hypothetical protein